MQYYRHLNLRAVEKHIPTTSRKFIHENIHSDLFRDVQTHATSGLRQWNQFLSSPHIVRRATLHFNLLLHRNWNFSHKYVRTAVA